MIYKFKIYFEGETQNIQQTNSIVQFISVFIWASQKAIQKKSVLNYKVLETSDTVADKAEQLLNIIARRVLYKVKKKVGAFNSS
jgi:hypothetical protein